MTDELETGLLHLRTLCDKYPEFADFIDHYLEGELSVEDFPYSLELHAALRVWVSAWAEVFTDE